MKCTLPGTCCHACIARKGVEDTHGGKLLPCACNEGTSGQSSRPTADPRGHGLTSRSTDKGRTH